MKLLLLGGTGTISSGVTAVARQLGIELYILTRRQREICDEVPADVKQLVADYADDEATLKALGNLHFDCVIDFIINRVGGIERATRIWQGRTDQYIYISSASAYIKPLPSPFITEEMPLGNPYWEYSRNKIKSEEELRRAIDKGFPGVIVRPSLTYSDFRLLTSFTPKNSSWGIFSRMLAGKPLPVQGDGLSLWVITHCTDFAKGILGLAGNPATIGEAFHITSDEVLTWNQIYECLGAAVGVKPNLHHVACDRIIEYNPKYAGILLGDHANSVIFDNSKIKRFVPGFKCEIPFAVGAKRIADWYDAHPEAKIGDPEWEKEMDAICKL